MKHCVISLSAIFAGILAASSPTAPDSWQSAAQWHRLLKKSVPGTLRFDRTGVEFRSRNLTRSWSYEDIRTFDLSPHELILTSYENRSWHEPGERRYRFTVREPISASAAANLAARVGKPARNGVPPGNAAAFVEIPAHLRAHFGGSNGTLRLKNDGIDYVAEEGHRGRSWRWADIQTLANPNPYELRVMAYREIAEFELKEPLPRAAFERLWNRLNGTGLNLFASEGAGR